MSLLRNSEMKAKHPFNKTQPPRFYRWGGCGVPYTWSFGWLTGRDKDLVCVKPFVQTTIMGEVTLSPVCSYRLLAFCAFALKAMLIRIDHNLRGLES